MTEAELAEHYNRTQDTSDFDTGRSVPLSVKRDVTISVRFSFDEIEDTYTEEEADLLRQESAGKVFMGEHELALAMAGHVLAEAAVAGVYALNPAVAAALR